LKKKLVFRELEYSLRFPKFPVYKGIPQN